MRRFKAYLPRFVELTEEEKRRIKIMDDYVKLKRENPHRRLNIRWLCDYKWCIDHTTFYRLRARYNPRNLGSIKTRRRGPVHGKTIPWETVVKICAWRRNHPEKGHVYYWHELDRADGAPCASGTIYNYWKARGLIEPTKKREPKPPRETVTATRVGQLLEMDTSDKDGGTEWTIIDTYSRWKYSQWYPIHYPEITMVDTIVFLEEVFGRSPFTWERVQMDNGKEFQSQTQTWLLSHGISYQYTWSNTPEQNGHVERSFKTDIDEFYRFFSPAIHSLTETKEAFRVWNEKYNKSRLHSAIGWVPPIEYLKCLNNS
jgi:putative transposase